MAAIPTPKTSRLTKTPKKSPVSVQPVQAGTEEAGKTCSICADTISQGVEVVLCPFCKLPYHFECWTEIGGCGAYGCKAAPDVPKTETAHSDEFQPGWVAEKVCPMCRKNIIANALKCKFCGAIFPTERPMTREQFENREYDGPELLLVRNKVIGNFIFSALGCLFFISIISNSFFAFDAPGMFFRVCRLPPSLKILFYASYAISIFWGIAVVFFYLFGI